MLLDPKHVGVKSVTAELFQMNVSSSSGNGQCKKTPQPVKSKRWKFDWSTLGGSESSTFQAKGVPVLTTSGTCSNSNLRGSSENLCFILLYSAENMTRFSLLDATRFSGSQNP